MQFAESKCIALCVCFVQFRSRMNVDRPDRAYLKQMLVNGCAAFGLAAVIAFDCRNGSLRCWQFNPFEGIVFVNCAKAVICVFTSV